MHLTPRASRLSTTRHRASPAPVLLVSLLTLLSPRAAPSPRPAETPATPAPLAARLVSPRDGGFVSGRTSIEAEVDATGGLTIARVEIEIDGQLVATLTSPPWRIVQDFGPTYDAHLIRIKAHAATGETATAEASTRPLVVHDESAVELVNVFATVQDSKGRYIMDLDREDFLLLEDGRPQEISYFSRDRLPLTIAIVMDTSLSMEGREIDEARKAAVQFLATLQPGDQVGLVEFNDNVQLVHPLDLDREGLIRAINKLRAHGGTALYDAVARTSRLLGQQVGDDRRRAIILLSDGRDEAASGLTPGSVLTFEESLAEVVHASIILYAIGLGRDLDERLDFYGRLSVQEVLTRLARETGGRAFQTHKAERLKKVYEDIETELRHHYNLAYTPRILRHDGSWRAIELRVRRPGTLVNARRGYYAALDSPLF